MAQQQGYQPNYLNNNHAAPQHYQPLPQYNYGNQGHNAVPPNQAQAQVQGQVQAQGQDDPEERVFVVTEEVERLWARGLATARENIRRADEGLGSVRHPAHGEMTRYMLGLLLEFRRAELRRELNELAEVEYALALRNLGG